MTAPSTRPQFSSTTKSDRIPSFTRASVTVCQVGYDLALIAQQEADAAFTYVIEKNGRDALYTDAFCGRQMAVLLNQKSVYTINSATGQPFSLRSFTFEFVGASRVTVGVVTSQGEMLNDRVRPDKAHVFFTPHTHVLLVHVK